MALPKLDVPVFELKLLSSDKKISFRPFLVKEQKLLLMMNESEDGKEVVKIVKQIIQNCIVSDIDVNTLPIFDLEYIFLNLRARSVGEIVKLQYRCNNILKDNNGENVNCNSIEKFEVDLTKINPTIDTKYDKKIMFSENIGLVMKYPTFEDLQNIETTKEDELVSELISKCIDYIFDNENIYYVKDYTKEELTDFIDNLQQKDLEKIQNFFNATPKIKHTIDFKCKKCGYKEDIVLEGLQNFFV